MLTGSRVRLTRRLASISSAFSRRNTAAARASTARRCTTSCRATACRETAIHAKGEGGQRAGSTYVHARKIRRGDDGISAAQHHVIPVAIRRLAKRAARGTSLSSAALTPRHRSPALISARGVGVCMYVSRLQIIIMINVD